MKKSIRDYRQINELNARFLDFLSEQDAILVIDQETGVAYLAQESDHDASCLIFAPLEYALIDEVTEADPA